MVYDTSTSGSLANYAGTTLTISHTCSGDNRVLLVAVSNQSNVNITGVTYNGVAMTLIVGTGDAGAANAGIYALGNPASGANNIVVTVSAQKESGSLWAGGASFSIGNTSDPINVYATGTASGSTVSVSMTTTLPGCMMFDFMSLNSGSTSGIGADQTQIHSNASANWIKSSYKTATNAGSNSMSWTGNGSSGTYIALAMGPRNVPASVSDTVNLTDSVNAQRNLNVTVNSTVNVTDDVDADAETIKWRAQSKSTAPTWTAQNKS